LSTNVPVLDATSFVMPVHQNHGYSAAFGRIKGIATDAMSLVNLELIGGRGHVRHIKSSTHTITSEGRIAVNWNRYTNQYTLINRKLWQPLLYKALLPVWHFFLEITRPVRTALGLRSKGVRSRQKVS